MNMLVTIVSKGHLTGYKIDHRSSPVVTDVGISSVGFPADENKRNISRCSVLSRSPSVSVT